MGGNLESVSPWQTQVIIDNQTISPVKLLLASSPENPDPSRASPKIIAGSCRTAIMSGWFHEARATLLIRTSEYEAKVLRVPNASKVVLTLAKGSNGISLETYGDVQVENFREVSLVPHALLSKFPVS